MIDGEVTPSFFAIDVGLEGQELNDSFGLEKVCLHIRHRRPSDLKIELLSPTGTSVWLSNRNGSKNQYGYLNTCFSQNGFNGPIHEGQDYFQGEYSTEGRLEFFNEGQKADGVWVLLITDLKEGVVGKLEEVSITFGSNPAISNVSSCIVDSPMDCYSALDDGVLLPDLIVSTSLTRNNIQYYGPDHEEYPNQLRFAAAMANIGDGPLHIITTENWYCGNEIVEKKSICPNGNSPTNNVQQIIYKKGTSEMIYDTLKSGVMFFDNSPGHNHYHVQNWANFQLLKRTWWRRNPSKWKVIASSDKVSYCLFDNKICTAENGYCSSDNTIYSTENLPNYGLGKFTSCSSRSQGISVGGVDYYGINYEGQSIHLPPDIKSGKYYLWIEVDPNNEYLEINEDNNHILIPVSIE